METNESIIRKYEKVLYRKYFHLPSSIFPSRMLNLINLVIRVMSPGLIILLKLVLLSVVFAFSSKHFCYSIGTGVQLNGVMDLLVYLGKIHNAIYRKEGGVNCQ